MRQGLGVDHSLILPGGTIPLLPVYAFVALLNVYKPTFDEYTHTLVFGDRM
jgi:hypothetical protein